LGNIKPHAKDRKHPDTWDILIIKELTESQQMQWEAPFLQIRIIIMDFPKIAKAA
jgi:hypothetical protein